MVLHLDFETCCDLDIKKVGADVYSRHPSLIVTVVAWAFDDDPVQSMTLPPAPLLPGGIQFHLGQEGAFKAWNASFEWAILVNHFKMVLSPHQAVCTMQKALHSGLPAPLGDAGPAVGSIARKDLTAHRLMIQMSKPRKILPDGTRTYWHEDDLGKLAMLQAYCEQDVLAERDINSMIATLPPTEQAVSILDRKANERGVRLDLPFVRALKQLAKAETHILDRECAALTQGIVTSPGTQTAKLLGWIQGHNIPIGDVSKEAVAKVLDLCVLSPTVKRVLEIRQEVAKSSVKKLDAMLRCVGPGERVRGQLAYYGAFRTGRFAGRLVQPQNFPRPPDPKTVNFDQASFTRYMLQSIARGGADPDFVRAVWVGNPLANVAWSLRGCLIPAQGRAFVVRDLSQIEARVIAWLAGQQDILDVFARGEDVYVYTQKMLGLPSRQAGKTVVLGLGFGMGPAHFVEYAASNGVTISARESETMVADWRAANQRIVQFWYRLDDVAKGLLRDFRGATILRTVSPKISFTASLARNGTCLMTILLPSGRRLYYRNARRVDDAFGRGSIVYDGVDPYTKKWGDVRTWGSKLAENITQATARDVIIEAALAVDARGLGDLVLSVHDELVFEVDEKSSRKMSHEIRREVERRPGWALDLPTASEGAIMTRYGKG